MPCPDVIELERFVERDLDEQEVSRINAHLVACTNCAREVAEMSENLQLVSSLRRNHMTNVAPDFDFPVRPNPPPFGDEPDPDVVGPYRILRKLGQGGMGAVYEAQQENPRRVVALKMIRPGLISTTLLARFRHEAQVLGRLRHPGIAQIYEAGTHQAPQGRQPYFVMELVRGSTLIEYVQTRQLDERHRLELMARICDAVQHAHERGVIHRDLKPDNIIVDDSTGSAQPKILDFGVARVVDPDGQHTTLHTSVGQIVGTIAYMSPEQAKANASEIDTRSDVYALGVICYELLSGRLPYKLNRASVAESVRAIVQDDPTPLSTVLRSLRGDVTTIVGKALEKDRTRRYPSAAEMAADIRRHLKDEPITAHPPSTIYQLRKFARRNKGLVAGVVFAFVALMIGFVGTLLGMMNARHAAALARRESAKATAVNQFLNEMLGSANPYERDNSSDTSKGRDITVLQTISDAGRRLDAGSLKDQPLVEAAVRRTLGDSASALGDYTTAEAHLQRALMLDRQVLGPAHADVATDLQKLGVIRHFQGKLGEADSSYREALDINRLLFGENSPQVADVMAGRAAVLRDRGNLADAEDLLRRALAARIKVLGDDDLPVAMTCEQLAVVLQRRGKGNEHEAETLERRALAIRRKVLGDHHLKVTISLSALGYLLYNQGRLAEAEPLFRESLEIRSKLLGDDHPDVAEAMANLAAVLREQGKSDEAMSMLRRALQIERQRLGDDHPTVAQTMTNLTQLLLEHKKFAEAEPLVRKAIETQRAKLGADSPGVANSLNNLGGLLMAENKPQEAEPFFREALAIRIKRLGEANVDTANLHMNLGHCLKTLKQFDESESELQLALKAYRSLGDDRHVGMAQLHLVRMYEAWNNPLRADVYRTLVAATRPTTQPTTTVSAAGK